MDDLYHLLARRDRLGDVLTQSASLHTLQKVLDDPNIDIGLEQGQTNVAKGLVDVPLREFPLTSERREHLLETLCQ